MILRDSRLVQGMTFSLFVGGPFFRFIHADVLRRLFLDLR